jgi:hypothetical protein
MAQSTKETNRPGPGRKPPANIMHVGYRGPQVINDSDHGRREKEVYKHLKNVKSGHTGSMLVRRAIDDFQISSADNFYTY